MVMRTAMRIFDEYDGFGGVEEPAYRAPLFSMLNGHGFQRAANAFITYSIEAGQIEG